MAATASYADRFTAAVNVIQNLPKNGPFQPTTAMMLKFYGLYKQATEGPAPEKKPSFWDIIGKAKWDAWNKNRNLTKDQAMQKYVEGLGEIIETMSFTENVQSFVNSLDNVNINLDDLELLAPGMKEKALSHPNSPFNSRTNSPFHGSSASESSLLQAEDKPLTNGHASDLHLNGNVVDENDNDTKNSIPDPANHPEITSNHFQSSSIYVDQSDDEYGDPYDIQNDINEALTNNTELLKQIQTTVLRMNADVAMIQERLQSLEKEVCAVVTQKKCSPTRTTVVSRSPLKPRWWPFEDISPAWFVLLIMWPFLANRFARLLSPPQKK